MEKVEMESKEKSQLLYTTIEQSGMFHCPVPLVYRSRMNVVFRIVKNGTPDSELEKLFCKQAEERKMICLAGHRSVGGVRASLYNALTLHSVETLVKFMHSFEKENK
jgi:phosphoserine aminotransferase